MSNDEKPSRDNVEIWTTAKGEIVAKVKLYVKEEDSLLDDDVMEKVLNRQRAIWNGIKERFPSIKVGGE